MGFLGRDGNEDDDDDDVVAVEEEVEAAISSAPRTRAASRITFVSTIQVKALPCGPPDARPEGPLSN